MAPGEVVVPPDPGEYYKCHPKKKNSTYVCIVCENVYHKCDFEEIKKPTIKISNVFVVCPEHEQLDLTNFKSDVSLNDTAKCIIAQIKLKQQEQIREEYLSDIINNTNNVDLNVSSESELEVLRAENTILKQLVAEMKDKNKLLAEQKNSTTYQDKEVKKTSYAQVLQQQTTVKDKKIPKIIVKKKIKSDDLTQITRYVAHYVNKKKNIQTKKLTTKDDSEVHIECMNEASVNEAEKTLKDKLSGICVIEKEQVKKPRLMVVGINNFEAMDMKALESDINQRNFSSLNSGCEVVHVFKNKNPGLSNLIMEVTSEVYRFIKENKSRVFVGYQNCKVYDDINVRPCYNCGRFGHAGHKCNNETVCLKCSGSHRSINCKSTTLQCLNCIYNNTKFNTTYDTQHVANDSQCCQTLKNKIKKYIDNVDYPISPTIPRYIGKIDISLSKTTITTSNATTKTIHRTTASKSLSSSAANSPLNIG